jgi:hypothetical protein
MFDVAAPPPSAADVVEQPGSVAAELAAARPGPDLIPALSLLDPATLAHAGRVDLLVALERHAAWLAAVQQRVLAAMAADPAAEADPVDRTGRGWVREDVSSALRLSGVTAQRRLDVAQSLTGDLPATLALLRRGEISYRHAQTLAEAVEELDGEQRHLVQERVLARAGEQTLAEFTRAVRRAVATVAAVDQQRVEAMAERRVAVTAREDGMAELWALLPAESAAAVIAAVDALASVTSADDRRTGDQRRADALVDLGVAALHDPRLPRAQGLRPAIQVTVALSTLLGADELPGELAGHGPIPAALARRLAADESGTWRRLVTDPLTGGLLDYGRTTYRPPKDLAEFVIARDQVCMFPGCNRRAHRCELDHRIPYHSGGSTNPENLGALCKRHHTAKHQADWTPHCEPDGHHTWTSPTNHRYRSRPTHRSHRRRRPALSKPRSAGTTDTRTLRGASRAHTTLTRQHARPRENELGGVSWPGWLVPVSVAQGRTRSDPTRIEPTPCSRQA